MSAREKQDKDVNKFQAEAHERLKELAAINHTTQILYEGKSIEETLYLSSIPGMRDSIIDGLKTPIDKLESDLDW